MPNVTNFYERRNESEWQDSAKNTLRSFDCTISYQRPNGTIDKIYCTLRSRDLPVPEGNKNKKPSEEGSMLAVYDIDERKWKTIPYEKIIRFKVETPVIKSMN